MLCPEFEKFPAPESHIQYTRYPHGTQHQIHDKLIKQQYFTTQVSVLLPGCVMIPPEITRVLTHDTQYYHITALPLHHLTSSPFIQAFVDTGDVYALSCDTMLDVDDSAVLTPDGKLRFLVDKFKYQRLPLSGRLSQHILRKPKDKYVVTVDLEKQLKDERVKKALTEANLVFDFWVAWLPYDPEVCPSSIAKYFCDLGFEVRQRETQIRWGNTSDVLMPKLGREEEEEEVMEEGQEEEKEEWDGEKEEEEEEEESMEVEEEEATHKQQQEYKKIIEPVKQSEEKTEDEEMFIGFLEETASKKPSGEEEIGSEKQSGEKETASGKPSGKIIASEKPSGEDIGREKPSGKEEIESKKSSRGEEQIFILDTKGHESKEETGREEEEEMDPEEVLEWIGCQALGINLVGKPTTVCDIDAPHPSIPINNVCSAHFTGFFLPHIITSLLHKLREWLRTRRYIRAPWLSMTAYGHPDSLVAWGGQEHRYNVNGDNFYTLIIARKEVRVYKISGPRKPARVYAKANNNK